MRIAFFALLIASSVAHADVYRCKSGGKVVFSDLPCESGAKPINVRPAGGAASQDPARPSTERAKLDEINARLKRKELDADIEREERHLETIERDRDTELSQLREKKSYARNNLAGATWEQSISSEMIAVTNKYESKIRAQQRKIDEMKSARSATK